MERFADELRKKRCLNKLFPGDTDYWPTYNSPIEDYDRTFKAILERNRIVDLVNGKTNPVVVDLMSSTEALASLFMQLPQQNKLGIAVSLKDDRDQKEKTRDESLGIEHLAGDLSMPLTWKSLKGKLKGKSADLILARGGMGVQYLPLNEKFYAYVFNRLWGIVSKNGGIILIQTPTAYALRQTGIRVKEWVNLLKADGVSVAFSEGEDDLGFDYARIKLVRTPKSPTSLPFLK